ncbi:MAG: ADP-ribosylglycohydrolase family protein [bacterium]|nr:ADP-ribosylglycohydrolase family protein [bacterium]
MIHPNPDILLYTAIGDAYCLCTEYIKYPQHQNIHDKALKFEQYLSHPSHNQVPGTFSDDTQMSIANTHVLLNDSWDELNFANSWVDTFKEDPRDSYSRKFQKYLEDVTCGAEFLNTIISNSNKNGAAMRSSVFGVINNPIDVLNITTLQAKITHNSPGGLFGAQAVALMSHYSLHESGDLTRDRLGEYLRYWLNQILKADSRLVNVFREPWAGRVAGDEVGIITALATFEIIISSNSLLQVLQKTIEFGGDTDSVAAIALGIASARMIDDLPAFMHDQLEIGSKYGPKFLKDLGSKLMVKFS